jgi:hypothetical protein
MKARILLSMVLVALMIVGCVPLPDVAEVLSEISVAGSGNVITKEFDLSGFDQVEVSGTFVAHIMRGDSFSVVVGVDEKLEQYLRVQVAGRTLEVTLAPNLSILGTATREVEITMPELGGLQLTGATQGAISGFDSTADLSVEVSGASKLGGDIHAGDATVEVSGASTVGLSGSGGALVLNVSGASTADLSDFSVNDANVEATGASTVRVNASGRLDAEASGASRILYLGNPTLGRIDSSGASTIEQG